MVSIWTSGLVVGFGLIVAIGAQNAFVLRQGIRREHVAVVVLICMLGDILLVSAGTAGIGVLVERVPWLITVLKWAGAVYLLWFAYGSFRSAAQPQALSTTPGGTAGIEENAGRENRGTLSAGESFEDTGAPGGAIGTDQGVPGATAVSARGMTSSSQPVLTDMVTSSAVIPTRHRQSKAAGAAANRSMKSVAFAAFAITFLNPHVYLDTVIFLGSIANQHGSGGKWIFALGAITASTVWFIALGLGARALAGPLGKPKVWQALDVIIGIIMIVIATTLIISA